MYQKALKRIEQYLKFLDRKRYAFCKPEFTADNNRKLDLQDPLGKSWNRGGAIPKFSGWMASCTAGIDHQKPEDVENWNHVTFPYQYGDNNESWWFETTLIIPDEYRSREFFIEIDSQVDTMVYFDGEPAGAVNPFHKKVRVFHEDGVPSQMTVTLEQWSGHYFPGYSTFDEPRVITTIAEIFYDYPLRLEEPRILIKSPVLNDLYYDVYVLHALVNTLDVDSQLYGHIIAQLHTALMSIDMTEDEAQILTEAEAVREKIAPLLALKNGTLAPEVLSVGNAHLDHAWLWPIEETERKAARTCANMVAYAREFPEFRFLFSQPVQMVKIREDYPGLFKEIKRAYDRGQWEPNGCSWVEPDCNLIGGESLIRQFLYGRTAIEDLFDGYRGDTFWVPDTFGFAGSVPQILRKCGVEYFVTNKLSWNDTERIPFDIFNWEGIDGTTIPSHMITTAYEGKNEPQDVLDAYKKIIHKDIEPILLRSIGEGDGGGGTMRADLELERRMSDLQGLPRNRWETLSQAMKKIFPEDKKLPVFKGELYLEMHRGTLTSQAKIKQYNRKLEAALHDLEFLEAAISVSIKLPESIKDSYLLNRDEAWKILLTNQFHDILPGSCVESANKQALIDYQNAEILIRDAEKILEEAAGAYNEGCIYWNTRSTEITSLIEPEDSYLFKRSQKLFSFNTGVSEVVSMTLPGFTTSSKDYETVLNGTIGIEDNMVTTPFYTIILDEQGGFSSCVTASNEFELIQQGTAGNILQILEDIPYNWDAWDIEVDYELKTPKRAELVSRKVLSEGTLFIQVEQVFKLGKQSTATQHLLFYAHTARIDCRMQVKWQEEHALLQVKFPSNVSSEYGYYDIPFGYITRTTHTNRLVDQARFEASAHQWALLKDHYSGVGILSDCKYGYSIKEGVLSLSLLRASTAPDRHADKGTHEFTYAFMPGVNDLKQIMQAGEELNYPLKRISKDLSPYVSEPLAAVDAEAISIETIKTAEDSTGFIVRIQETLGTSQKCRLKLNKELSIVEIKECSMLEDELRSISLEKSLRFTPFEIKTLKIVC